MISAKRNPLQLSPALFLIAGVFLCALYQATCEADLTDGVEEAAAETETLEEPLTAPNQEKMTPEMHSMHYTDSIPNQTAVHHISTVPETPPETPTQAPPEDTIPSDSPGTPPPIGSNYPADLFSIEDRRRGWVILHIFGVMYMFISLAVVCDEFFVPSLWVIIDKLAVSEDVAGAIIMAVGRTAPKRFPLLVGAFITHSSVGFGSIVGSAVFNILFVIGMCTLFSREVLHLTRWPFFRDVSFYILSLILLIIFFLDSVIIWWESMTLVSLYILYVIFMKYNVQIEQAIESQLHKHKNSVKVVAVEEPEKEVISAASEVVEDPERDEDGVNRREQTEKEKQDLPLSLKWPDTRCKQAVFLFLLPVIFPLWLTLPDVRNQKSKKYFVVTFLGSIVWINVFFYFMVWWTHQLGETFGIPEPIMGLTILAAGTSMPDLITSGIMARRGLADMVVSSSVGCNILDVTVGLPLPWLLYSFIHHLTPVTADSSGLACASVLLFLVLGFFIISIVSCKWKISKVLGLGMVFVYLLFVVVSVMMLYRILVCPASIG